MKTAAIVIDSWKSEIFDSYLTAAGHVWRSEPGPVPNTLSLFVNTKNVQALAQVVHAANKEAARNKPNGD